MKMTTTTKWMLLSMTLLSLNACKKDAPVPVPNPPANNTGTAGPYDSGIFITNEGQFPSGAGSVSFYNRTTKTVSNDIFQQVNKYPLGSVVQSFSVYNGKGYIVVNNANKIEIVSAADFKSGGTITGVMQPRYFLPINANKAYVSEWGDGGIKGAVRIINLNNNTISGTILTGLGAENMVKVNDFVYVACSGGNGKDSIITIINSAKDTVLKKLVVGANPGSLQIDVNGKIWVLCNGQNNATFTGLDKPSKLVRINPATNAIEQSMTFTSMTSGASNLTINAAKTKLYYNYAGGIYSQEITSNTLSPSALINRGVNFYGLGVDPVTDYIFGTDPGNYSSNGYVFRYTNTGAKIDSFQVGVVPGNFFFK